MEVSGFSLFVLSHNFGRRARAMVRSLALQESCPVPIHLTVFYSNQGEANLINEGRINGFDFPHVRLVRIDNKRIMQRAMHYSTANHSLSHTVFCDADLWYPGDFWRKYTEAVQAAASGYWSCQVLDIPFERAEQVVQNDQWEGIRRELLDPLSSGIRNDGYQGRVGVFQCIPKDLLQYPEDLRHSVETLDLVFSDKALELSEDKRPDRRIGLVPAYHLGHPYTHYGTDGEQY